MRVFIYFSLLISVLLCTAQPKLFEQAEEKYVLGNYKESLSVINQKIERSAEADDFLLRALIYTELDIRSNAHDDFVKAITLDPDHLEAYYHFAHFLTDSHEYERAVAALSVMLEKVDQSETQGIFFRIDRLGDQRVEVGSVSGMESHILMARGLAFMGLGMFEKALTDYNAAIFMSESADKYVNRANLLEAMKLEKEAISDLRKAIELDPGYGLAWYNLFVLDTNTDLPKFLKSNTEFGPLLSARAVEAMENGQYHLAEKLYEAAIELNPNDDLLLVNAGRLDLRNGFNRAGLKKFTLANKLNPERAEVLYLIGNAFFGMKQYTSAIEFYEKYLRNSPNSADIWHNTAMAYLELKKYQEACECLQRSGELGMKQSEKYFEKYCTED